MNSIKRAINIHTVARIFIFQSEYSNIFSMSIHNLVWFTTTERVAFETGFLHKGPMLEIAHLIFSYCFDVL